MKRNPDGTINMDALDPHVATAFEEGQLRKAGRSMTKRQRQQAKRNRMTFDLSPQLEEKLTQIAADFGVPVSQLAEFLLLRGLDHTSEDDLYQARTPSRSMRYEFNLFPREATPKGDTKRRH